MEDKHGLIESDRASSDYSKEYRRHWSRSWLL